MRHLIILLAAILIAALPARAHGPLVIVGGGLSDDNDAVFGAFLGALPAPDMPIAIVPAASGVPAQSAAAFAAQLERRGVAPDRIRIIRLAVEDDPATPEDESAWAANAEDDGEVMRFAGVGGIWFTGGDQARIAAALVRQGDAKGGGDDTAMLSIMRTRLAAGAVIGGTSAGAAIMSRLMIRQGDPLSLLPSVGVDAVANARDAPEPILTGSGLGFLRAGLVDQHFGERARLIRLVAALRALDPHERTGFGIDEDTALVIAPDQQSARVVGSGRVTLVDARNAQYNDQFGKGQDFAVRGAAIATMGHGDTLDLQTLMAPPAPTPPAAPCLSAPSGAGVPKSESRLVTQLAGSLKSGDQAICLLVAGETGLAMRFHRSADGADDRLMLDLVPVAVRSEPLAR